ncbi:hypothetical protein H5410_019315 [Solanum commersonii]|uniref:Uncharacterized protein n=1 Tax=Solanum commersonii TaxID=4109 RepID=A0A9J5Z5W6_SOLCO|nr:hypothetical protein H5410_019315 [Solanum commersonii]
MDPEQVNPHFADFCVLQSTGFIGNPEFQRHFRKKFTWTSVKILAMEPVGHHSQNDPFSRSNEPQSK